MHFEKVGLPVARGVQHEALDLLLLHALLLHVVKHLVPLIVTQLLHCCSGVVYAAGREVAVGEGRSR